MLNSLTVAGFTGDIQEVGTLNLGNRFVEGQSKVFYIFYAGRSIQIASLHIKIMYLVCPRHIVGLFCRLTYVSARTIRQ